MHDVEEIGQRSLCVFVFKREEGGGKGRCS